MFLLYYTPLRKQLMQLIISQHMYCMKTKHDKREYKGNNRFSLSDWGYLVDQRISADVRCYLKWRIGVKAEHIKAVYFLSCFSVVIISWKLYFLISLFTCYALTCYNLKNIRFTSLSLNFIFLTAGIGVCIFCHAFICGACH